MTWTYDAGELEASRGGEVRELTELAPLVACVPQAENYADSASLKRGFGVGLRVAGLGGFLAGGGLTVAGAVEDPDIGMVMAGLSALMGGALIAVIGAAIDRDKRSSAVDAVNFYNDHYESTPGCTGPSGHETSPEVAGEPPQDER